MDRIKQLLDGEAPLRWLFYGDSITHGAAHTLGWRDYTQHFHEWVRYERGRYLDVVINTAISGNTTRELLKDFEWRAAQFRPHVAFVMVGMNDCEESRALSPAEFGLNMHRLCDEFAKLETIPVLQTTCPIHWELPGGRVRIKLREYMEAVRQIAKERELPLIDHFDHWERQFKEKPLRAHGWMNDAIHPGATGHSAFAEFLISQCGELNPNQHLANVLKYKL